MWIKAITTVKVQLSGTEPGAAPRFAILRDDAPPADVDDAYAAVLIDSGLAEAATFPNPPPAPPKAPKAK